MRDGDIDAFPRPMVGSPETGTVDFGASGMTLLDYFAGQALVGVLANPGNPTLDAAPELAYLIADGMLKQRAKSAK